MKVPWDDVAAIVLLALLVAVAVVVALYVVDWLQTCAAQPVCGE